MSRCARTWPFVSGEDKPEMSRGTVTCDDRNNPVCSKVFRSIFLEVLQCCFSVLFVPLAVHVGQDLVADRGLSYCYRYDCPVAAPPSHLASFENLKSRHSQDSKCDGSKAVTNRQSTTDEMSSRMALLLTQCGRNPYASFTRRSHLTSRGCFATATSTFAFSELGWNHQSLAPRHNPGERRR
jgi:hypothetical protein